MHKNQILVLMGPTGSGKSALAIRIAQAQPTVIINADAMQLVSTLRVITARPTAEEEAAAEHTLYGVLPPESPTSVAVWLGLVAPIIRRAWAEGKRPLLVGGTGMYIKALMDGLATIPPIPDEIRQRVRALVTPPPIGGRMGGGLSGHVGVSSAESGEAAFDNGPLLTSPLQGEEQRTASLTDHASRSTSLHALLTTRDPIMAAQLKPGDTQRLLRALEVIEATGTSLAVWQQQTAAPLFPDAQFSCYYMDIPRDELYARINQRFTLMMEHGALDEVRALLAQNLHPDTPILRAHGVPELAATLAGTMTLEDAITIAQQHTRNYAKRQVTWIRNQLPHATPVSAYSTEIPEELA